MAQFDYKKMLVKGAWGLLYALVTGLIVVYTDDPKWVAIMPVLMMIQNYLKNR